MSPQSNSLRVYLVEDSTILGTLLIEMFRIEEGVLLVGRSKDAATAISEIAEVKPDIVVLDIALQSGNGFDVVKAFPQRADEYRPSFFVLTNYAIAQFRDAAQRLGVNHFFEKSTEIITMFNVIRSMMIKTNHVDSGPSPRSGEAKRRTESTALGKTPSNGRAGPTPAS